MEQYPATIPNFGMKIKIFTISIKILVVINKIINSERTHLSIMRSISEAILLLNWIKESGILASTDYGFLTNLYIETVHLAEQQPSDEEGRRMQRQLYRKAHQISDRIDDLEQHIDIFLSEYFEATASQIAEEENQDSDEQEYRRTVIEVRDISIEWVWKIDTVEGPIGEVPSTNEYDFTEFDTGAIDDLVREWVEGYSTDIEDHIDLDDEDGSDQWDEILSIDFDDELAPITITVNVELTVSWGEGSGEDDGWRQY